MRALIVPADLSKPMRVENITAEMDELQELVGGHFQVIGLGSLKAVMCLDEESKLKSGVQPNVRATDMVSYYTASGDIIMGDVVVLGPFDGDVNADLSEETINDLIFGPSNRQPDVEVTLPLSEWLKSEP